jgi:hypothetical protein
MEIKAKEVANEAAENKNHELASLLDDTTKWLIDEALPKCIGELKVRPAFSSKVQLLFRNFYHVTPIVCVRSPIIFAKLFVSNFKRFGLEYWTR